VLQLIRLEIEMAATRESHLIREDMLAAVPPVDQTGGIVEERELFWRFSVVTADKYCQEAGNVPDI
jgi:hypothetical protein